MTFCQIRRQTLACSNLGPGADKPSRKQKANVSATPPVWFRCLLSPRCLLVPAWKISGKRSRVDVRGDSRDRTGRSVLRSGFSRYFLFVFVVRPPGEGNAFPLWLTALGACVRGAGFAKQLFVHSRVVESIGSVCRSTLPARPHSSSLSTVCVLRLRFLPCRFPCRIHSKALPCTTGATFSLLVCVLVS